MTSVVNQQAQVFRLKLLGSSTILRDGRVLTGGMVRPRRIAVLAMLARGGPGGVSRDRLLATLWPGIDEERARHSLNQIVYAIRRDIGDDDVITGARDLRLNAELLAVDVIEFQSALAQRDLQRAAQLYEGRFLDAFHLPGSDTFERWVERERASLDLAYTNLLEQLAREATGRKDHAGAVESWRARAAHDPLDARVAIALMQALDAAGDRVAAIQHARIYELLIEAELSIPPDRDVVRYANELRGKHVAAAAEPSGDPSAEPEVAVAQVHAPAPDLTPIGKVDEPATPPPSRGNPRPASWPTFRRHALLGAAAIVGVVALGILAGRRWRGGTERSAPIIAVGRLTDHRTSDADAIAGAVTDLLATNLARANGVRVLSTARMYDLLRRVGDGRDSSSSAFASAAQQAGAEELIDGALYDRDGRLRLDLRRIDLATGAVRAAYSIEARGLFALADSGASRILADLGVRLPLGSVADVTTRSAAAYRMYEEGLKAHFHGDVATARRMFEAAVAEDSLFALAEYSAAMEADDPIEVRRRLERARRLTGRTTDRERLTIMAGWAHALSLPTLRAIAETLAVRYPTEVSGHLYLGIARVMEGNHLEAIGPLDRVVAMDSAGLRHAVAGCGACDALRWIISAYELADSLPAAERVARQWIRLQPDSRAAAHALIEVLDVEGRAAEADSVNRASGRPMVGRTVTRRAENLIRAGDFDAADRLLADLVEATTAREQLDAYWTLAISLRQQGRLTDALDVARRLRPLLAGAVPMGDGAAPTISVLEAQILLELGRPRMAAALFDSIARGREAFESAPVAARRSAWNLAHSAGARAAAGDTVAVARLIDSVQALGAVSGFGRDRQLHHYVRGLLLVARHDDSGAVAEFQQAIVSRNFGYTRTNYELARAFMRLNRPADAVAALQPALRGSVESSNLYVTRTELHELLAQAWDSANVADSAAAHYRVVGTAWKRADPPLQARRARAEARASALGR